VLRGLDRAGVVPGCDAISRGYYVFNGYGDVIVYSPMGDRNEDARHPPGGVLGERGPAHVAGRPRRAPLRVPDAG